MRRCFSIALALVFVFVLLNVLALCGSTCAQPRLWLRLHAPALTCALLHRPLVLLHAATATHVQFRLVLQSACDAAALTPLVACGAASRVLRVESASAAAVTTMTIEVPANGPVVCEVQSERFEFQLAWPNRAERVTAVVVSDSQRNVDVYSALLRAARRRDDDRPVDLVLFGGDAVQNGEPLEWTQYAAAYEELGRVVPIAHARGNHDSGALAPLFGPSAPVVAFAFGAAHVLVLDSSFVTHPHAHAAEARVAFAAALQAAVASEAWRAAAFRVAVAHVPRRIAFWEPRAWHERGEKREPAAVAAQLWPVLLAARCDVLIGGHSHMYSYAAERDAAGGGSNHTVHEFIVGGGGGALESANERVVEERFASVELLVHHSVRLSVEAGCRLEWTAFGVDGRVLHHLFLKSSSNFECL